MCHLVSICHCLPQIHSRPLSALLNASRIDLYELHLWGCLALWLLVEFSQWEALFWLEALAVAL